MATTSLAGLGLSGLSSGLDTSGIITKLMAIESAPQAALKSRLGTATTYRTALQSLNSSVAAIATSAKDAAKPGALASFTAASDTTSVKATASSTASAGAVSFTVDRLASAQVSVSRSISTWDTAQYGTLTFRRGGDAATDTTVTFGSNNLDDVVATINTSGAGVSAGKIAAGRDATSGATLYRLQLRSATGEDNAFAVSAGSSFGSDDAASMGLVQVGAAQDAQITLYKGIAGAEQAVTSSTNSFDELLTGVGVTVSAVSAATTTVSVAADTAAATTAASGLTASLVQLFSGIASATAITTTTGSAGGARTSGSVLTGDSAVRQLKDSLLAAVSGAVGDRSPSSIGITLTKDGTIVFDQSRFAAAMASDPSATTAMFQAIAGRVAASASAASDRYTGTLTQKIAAQQSTESSMTKEIGDWDTRLATIQAQYAKQFNALETALNALSSQSSYLTSQIAGLTTNYQNG